MIGRWRLIGGASQYFDPLGSHRTDIFAGAAAGAELLVDSDSHPRNEFDGIGAAAFHTGETAAVSGQALFVIGHGHPVFTGRGDEVGRAWNRHGVFRRTCQNSACRAKRFPEREQAFPEKILAAYIHGFICSFFSVLVSLITPCPWHPVQDNRSG